MVFIKFKPCPKNAGPVTIQRNYDKVRTLHFGEGKPLTGGELVAGELYEVDLETGKTRKIAEREA